MRILSLISVFLFFMACSGGQAMKDPMEHFSHVKTIAAPVVNRVELEIYGIYKPWECVKTKNKFIVFDRKSSNVFASISVDNGTFYQGINIGDGPNDVLLPERFIKEGDFVTFYDGATMKRYRLAESDSSLYIELYKDIGIEAISYPTFSGDKMATKGWTGNSWLRYYIGKREIGQSAFPYFKETNELNDIDKLSVFRGGQQKFSPDGSKLVATIDNGCALAIYDCTNNGLKEVTLLKYFPPVFKKTKYSFDSTTFTKDTKFGFVDVCCSEKYIYALYSGKLWGDDMFTAAHGKHVFVYDWKGNPVVYYQLEKELFMFDIDESNNLLYGIGYDPEGCILEFKL